MAKLANVRKIQMCGLRIGIFGRQISVLTVVRHCLAHEFSTLKWFKRFYDCYVNSSLIVVHLNFKILGSS